MAPFEMWSGFEWREIWDSWTIRGGSDGGGFSVLCGHENDPRLVHDWPRDDGELLPSVPGMCAGGPRGLLDSSTVRSAAGRDLLTLDGWWIEDGYPVHGACDSPQACSHLADGQRYASDAAGYLDALAADAILVKLKCHG
ncbi:hypothetical protein [Streptacidiphilus sp. MAP12-16]|uniref:hypothetical protein n=1 Tax=Streptacidiphilus sp. MAP12-16 TaxID=3156300 RepID=UPI003513A2CA